MYDEDSALRACHPMYNEWCKDDEGVELEDDSDPDTDFERWRDDCGIMK